MGRCSQRWVSRETLVGLALRGLNPEDYVTLRCIMTPASAVGRAPGVLKSRVKMS